MPADDNMPVVDELYLQGHRFAKDALELLKWHQYSSLHKLAILAAVASIAAVFLNHWGPLIALIISVAAFVKLTGNVLSGRWIVSSDPLASYVERLDGIHEALTAGINRSMGKERNLAQEFRARSESIASPHIPDLEVGLDPAATGSTFSKNIRLELNSIVLLIVRDFVQFWYHTFSYNSQFLKDSRQFLFKGIHSLVERVSYLKPHPTSAKLIRAYQGHLSSFQTARILFEAQDPSAIKLGKGQAPQLAKTLQRLESIDEAFHSKFHFHPALESKEKEKEYLRSVTKTILLCACARDVVSPSSAQIFFIEVLSINVLLPVVEMLSTPDRLYEILIRLTYYDEDVILNDDVLKQLIQAQVEKTRLQSSVQNEDSHLQLAAVAEEAEDEKPAEDTKCDQPSESESSRASTSRLSASVGPTISNIQHGHTDTSKEMYKNLKHCTSGSESPKFKGRRQQKVGEAGAETVEKQPELQDEKKPESGDQQQQTMKCSSELARTSGDIKTAVQQKPFVKQEVETPSGSVADETENTESERENKEGTGESADGIFPSDVTDTGTGSEVKESIQENHVYGEIMSIGIPAIKPKLQAFKDLFKSKKSKQQEEMKLQMDSGVPNQDTDSDKTGATEAACTTGSEIHGAQRLSLRLSPLLSRSSKFFGSGNTDKLSTEDVARDGLGGKKSPTSGQESEKKTPSPLPTPSPSQQTKGGPLSFFRFRKPTLDFRKGSTLAAESKTPEPVGPDQVLTEGASAACLLADSTCAAAVGTVPLVQVTDEDAKSKLVLGSSQKQSAAALSWKTFSISSYDEVAVSDYQAGADGAKRTLFIALGEDDGEAEVGEEAETLSAGMEGTILSHPDSSFIFQDISIPTTSTGQEFRSNAPYTLYHIEYEALHFSESGLPVLRTGSVKRRHREFINLMSRLEDNSAYKKLLKDVKGPKRWQTLPFKNMDKDSVANRQKALEQFLKSLIQVEAACNGPELREFLAYEGDSHIAFVRKATEINVPRIDKMLARTVSGVFDKLKSLPSLPQEVISGIRGRDSAVDRREGLQEYDADSIQVLMDFSQEMEMNNALRDISEKFICDHHVQDQAQPEESGSVLEGGSNLFHQILQQVPRVEGDGAESRDDLKEAVGHGGMGDVGPGQLLLCDAVIDLFVQLLQGQGHWLCHQHVITVVHNTLGFTLDRWLKDKISSLTTEERCLYYIRVLRETVWPGGTFFSGEHEEKTPEQRAATRAVAKRLLLEFFPGVVHLVMGEDSMEAAAEQIMESLQYTKLNKHLIYMTLDMLMESLVPEMADPEFQGRLLA